MLIVDLLIVRTERSIKKLERVRGKTWNATSHTAVDKNCLKTIFHSSNIF